ncbi:uncharacterized protein LOC115663861 isoform X2 [Syzygium oleosum]|uniref:uncharacterized protein LOC115663861 isoform X2 n=1 Tax=Syzygium oleosum TaxID=219896 RepID=UPI0024BB2F0E|nr:uncharacterized protein LOC115663861 isoform X2 [Syzygium oleosum]
MSLREREILCLHLHKKRTRLCFIGFCSHATRSNKHSKVFPSNTEFLVLIQESYLKRKEKVNRANSHCRGFQRMENLIKQGRVRFLDPKEEEVSGSRQIRTVQQQTDSSKGDQKTQNWFTRQFSGQMSKDYDYGDGEYASAVAAAAFAICSLEENEVGKRTKMREDFASSQNKIKSKMVDMKTGPTTAKKVTMGSSNLEAEASAKKSPSTSITPKLNENRSRHSRKEDKADAWERAQIEKIRKRHESMKSSIFQWEKEKKTRAKRSFERKRNELEQRRSRNQQHYQYKVARYDQVAREARAQAEEKRRTEESQVKEKAKKIRSGEAPVICFCF